MHFQGSIVFLWGKEFFLVRLDPARGVHPSNLGFECLSRLFSHDSTTIDNVFSAVLNHLNKMTGAKYDGEDGNGDATG